jgi:hypothetical protein
MGSKNFALVVYVRYKKKEEEVRQQTEDSFSYLLIIYTGALYGYFGEFFYFLIWWVVLEFEIRTSCFV